MMLNKFGQLGTVMSPRDGIGVDRMPPSPAISEVVSLDIARNVHDRRLLLVGEALRFGAAAASAAVMTPDTRLCTPEDGARLLPLTTLAPI